MRQLSIAVCLAALLTFCAAPLFAQESDLGKRLERLENTIGSWSFYGSIRMQTMWQEQTGTKIGFMGSTPSGGGRELKFDLQDNNRIGGTVKRGNLSGGFEFGLDDTDPYFKTRLIFGKWSFDNGVAILAGQHYTPSVVGISSSTSIDDGNFFWCAPAYNGRRPQLTLSYGGLRVGLVKQHAQYIVGGAPSDAALETKIPKIEAIYTFRGKGGWVAVHGGYQTYTIKSDLTKNYDIDAYFIGITGKVNLGPASLAGSIWTGQNTAAYGLLSAGTYFGANKSAIAIENGSLKDEQAIGAIIVATYKATPALSFEAGVGYMNQSSDRTGAKYANDDETLGYYLQSDIRVGKYLRFIPEVGYFDYMDNLAGKDQGKMWYAGIQTRIDF